MAFIHGYAAEWWAREYLADRLREAETRRLINQARRSRPAGPRQGGMLRLWRVVMGLRAG